MTSAPSEVKEGTILLVDDQPEQIDLIKAALDPYYVVKVAIRGELVLKIAAKGRLDLILLDVMMPGMDGYEVCRQLKNNPETHSIPVIFLTGRNSQDDEAVGLALGAVDYIRKPSCPSVVVTRCRNTIDHQRVKEDLRRKNEALQQALHIREDMERLSRHDLKGPLSGMIGIPQLLLLDDNLTAGQREMLEMLEMNGYTMLEMINRSLDLYKMETGNYHANLEPFDLLDLLQHITVDLAKYAAPRDTHIVIKSGEAMLMASFRGVDEKICCYVIGEKMLCYPLFYNVILNAIEASCDHGTIKITWSMDNDFATVRITNPGEVPMAIREQFFAKYVTSGKKGGTGLGTYSAWLAAKTQGGSIQLDVGTVGETSLIVTLPCRFPPIPA